MIKFFVVLSVVASVIIGTAHFFHNQNLFILPTYLHQTVFMLWFGTGLVYFYLLNSGQSLFVPVYLLTIVLKLLAYLTYLSVIILDDRLNAAANVVIFMITYFIFTILEVGFLFKRINS